jgi:hypothetical protein
MTSLIIPATRFPTTTGVPGRDLGFSLYLDLLERVTVAILDLERSPVVPGNGW